MASWTITGVQMGSELIFGKAYVEFAVELPVSPFDKKEGVMFYIPEHLIEGETSHEGTNRKTLTVKPGTTVFMQTLQPLTLEMFGEEVGTCAIPSSGAERLAAFAIAKPAPLSKTLPPPQ